MYKHTPYSRRTLTFLQKLRTALAPVCVCVCACLSTCSAKEPCTGFTFQNIFQTQHTATQCNTLQHTATHCNTLQHKIFQNIFQTQPPDTHCHPLQLTATHCNPLQHKVFQEIFQTHVDLSQKVAMAGANAV